MPEKFCMICESYIQNTGYFVNRRKEEVPYKQERCILGQDIKKYYDNATNCIGFELTEDEY